MKAIFVLFIICGLVHEQFCETYYLPVCCCGCVRPTTDVPVRPSLFDDCKIQCPLNIEPDLSPTTETSNPESPEKPMEYILKK